MSTRTRFEKEARDNSEMAYCYLAIRRVALWGLRVNSPWEGAEWAIDPISEIGVI